MKKIHVIVKYFYPVTAGIETNILETYSVLAKKGWDVTVHTSKDEYLSQNSLFDTETIRGIKVIRYPFISDNIGFFPSLDWTQADLVCLHNFNVFFWRVFFYVFWLKITGRKKFALVLTPHGGFIPEWFQASLWVKTAKYLYDRLLGVSLINLTVDKIRAVSEWERQGIIKKGINPCKVVTITNGVENEAYLDIDKLASPQIKRDVKQLGRYIIQVGRIYKIKNYETTIKALPNIPGDIKYVIVGPSEKNLDYKNSLVKLADNLGVIHRVVFLGVVRGIDKYYLIKHAQMMVHMALWESFCNVVHEGLSQGLVCIVANAYALPYLIKDGVNGYLVDTFDSNELAAKINYVLQNTNSQKILSMKKLNQQLGLKDSWNNVAEKMNQLYLSL